MDSFIVQKWNETVGENDTVFVLGDVSSWNKEITT